MAELSLKTASLTSWKELVKALPDIFGAVKVEAAGGGEGCGWHEK